MRVQSLCTVRNAKRSLAGLLLGLALVTDGGAFAQDNATAPKAGAAVQSELAVKKAAVVSGPEQIAEAESIARRAGQMGERLTRMLDEARRDKDILRANCVNRKLTEVNANTRNVEQRVRALKDAVQLNDEGRRSHEFTVLTVLSAKLDALNSEATQCLGESLFEPGASQVVTTVPSNAPSIDPSVIPPSVAPPPAVSVPPPTEIPPMDSPTM